MSFFSNVVLSCVRAHTHTHFPVWCRSMWLFLLTTLMLLMSYQKSHWPSHEASSHIFLKSHNPKFYSWVSNDFLANVVCVWHKIKFQCSFSTFTCLFIPYHLLKKLSLPIAESELPVDGFKGILTTWYLLQNPFLTKIPMAALIFLPNSKLMCLTGFLAPVLAFYCFWCPKSSFNLWNPQDS